MRRENALFGPKYHQGIPIAPESEMATSGIHWEEEEPSRKTANISKTVDLRKIFLFLKLISVTKYESEMQFLGPSYHIGISIAPGSEMAKSGLH